MISHLSDDRLLDLARKVNQELDFTSRDQRDMMHIGACENCYRKLRATMLAADAADNAGTYIAENYRRRKAAGQKAAASVIIQVVFVNKKAILEQLHAQRSAWRFSESLAFAASRGTGDSEKEPSRLEDEENPGTHVTYDPAARTLAVQVDAFSLTGIPRVTLRFADGTTRRMELEKQDDFYWGEMTGLESEEFQIILEK